MEYTDRSFVARRYGNREEYLHYTRLAYEKEAAAAQLMKDEDVEPTRSVLHRSAATLAWRCEIYDKAKKLIHQALSGNPPSDIEYELYDLLGTVNLAQAGIYLEERQLQFSLNGREVGYGNAPVSELASRESGIRKMLSIAAKSAVRQFHESSSAKLNGLGEVSLYIDGIYPGSCNVSLRLGKPIQSVLPGFEHPDEIIAPFLENLRLFDQGEYDALEENIVDSGDYRDFVNAAKELAPDGDKISSVKFQARVGDQLQIVSFNRLQGELSEVPIPELPQMVGEPQTTVTKKDETQKGVLRVADAMEKTECVLVTDDDKKWTIEGPEDTLDEIVRAYFKRRVEVKGKRMRKQNLVDRIWLDSKENIRVLNDTDGHKSENDSSLRLF